MFRTLAVGLVLLVAAQIGAAQPVRVTESYGPSPTPAGVATIDTSVGFYRGPFVAPPPFEPRDPIPRPRGDVPPTAFPWGPGLY